MESWERLLKEKMENRTEVVIGIDTSNYTTSIAAIERSGKIILDQRKLLNVKQGERGLRQSDALFQHLKHLPTMLEEAFSYLQEYQVVGIGASNRPRPIFDSYMPVFLVGDSFARTISASLTIPRFFFSHQEGHLAAASIGTKIDRFQSYLGVHLSGGTCEMLLVKGNCIEIIGQSKDISFGQVIDRIGVRMELDFPAGSAMDKHAVNYKGELLPLRPVQFTGLDLNLSGLETQAIRYWESGKSNVGQVSASIFQFLSDTLHSWIRKSAKETGVSQVLITGGVAASNLIRQRLVSDNQEKFQIHFGEAVLSTDNAVGIAKKAGESLWG